MKNNNSIHVYLMPGLAANPQIFKFLNLDARFTLHSLAWFMPKKDEAFSEYARRMTAKIKHKNPVLLGVSFGGMLVQEMAKHIDCQKVIIISSVRTRKEFPIHMRITSKTKAYRLFPMQWVNNLEDFVGFVFGPSARKRMDLNKRYLSYRSPEYLDWALDAFFNWEQTVPLENVVHIHGTFDLVFPVMYLQDYIPVPKGTHVMIMLRATWFNENLPKIILDEF